METATPTAISLFSGMGGDTLGMSGAGFRVVAYNENNQAACDSHEANWPESVCIVGDKNKKNITEISDSFFEKYRGVKLVFAGFPCQGFSQAGKKLPDDPRNTLFREFVRAVRIIQPDYVLGENVKGILKRETAEHELFKDIIVREFNNLGYDMCHDTVECVKYGVPQLRERVLFLGVRKSLKIDVARISSALSAPDACRRRAHVSLRDIVNFDMRGAQKIPENVNIREIIGGGDGDDELWKTKVLQDMSNTEDTNNPHPYLVSKVVRGVTVGTEQPWTYKGKKYENLIKFGKRDPVGIEIIDLDKPSKTIISTYDHQPRLFVCMRNANGFYLRMLTVDEVKQIQGFPKDYIVSGNNKQRYVQVGNAVPPPVIKRVLENLIKS